MRRQHGPNWPTHKRKRANRALFWPKYVDDHAEPKKISPRRAAQELVDRGLASPLILNDLPPRRPSEDRGAA